MIDVSSELKRGVIFTAMVGILNHDVEDLDSLEYVTLGLTTSLKVRSHAERDALAATHNLNEEVKDKLYDVELRNRLIFWAVVYGLAVDDAPAYQFFNDEVKLDIDHIKNYIEYRLGQWPKVYEDLGLTILRESGLSEVIPEPLEYGVKEAVEELEPISI